MSPRSFLRIASLSLGIIILLTACMVIAGWVFHLPHLIQLSPDWTPMKFNTALMFAVSGLMTLTLALKKMRLSPALAALVIALPLLTLLQYVFGVDFHIDEAIVQNYIDVATANHGRMSPNTALCFIFCGLNGLLFSFQWFRRSGHFITGALAVFIATLGAISVSSYIFHFDSAYGWGNYSDMAMLTGLLFILEALAIGALLFTITDFKLRKRSSTLPMLAGTILLLITFAAWQIATQSEKSHIATEMKARATIFQQSARIFLDERLRALGRMALRAAATPTMAEKSWRFDAQNYLKDMPGLLALGFTDSDSKIRWLEPTSAPAIGLKLSREPVRAEAVRHSMATGETTVTHSVTLLTGKVGFIMIAPIKMPTEPVQGFMFMATDYTTFFSSFVDPNMPYDFQVFEIEASHPTLLFDRTTGHSMQAWRSEIEMHWKGVDWRITVIPHLELIRSFTSYTPVLTLLLGLIFAVFTSILVHLYIVSVEAKKEAEAATEAKARFLANMSHEIRTPLNGVIGLSHLLKKTELSAQQDDYLKGIMTSAEALLSLISDILDLSKIEAGKIRIETIDFNPAQVIHDCMSLMRTIAEQKNLKIESQLDADVPAWLKGDPFRLRQVLLNLLSNAIKFTDHGRVSLSIQVENKTESGCTLFFNVRDSGSGMSAETVSRLFGAFEQATSSTTRTHGGTGLGLSICKLLVEEMGGEIGVKSDVGDGSTFWFRLPYTTGVAQILQPKLSGADLEIRKGSRILVAEDNAINQKIALAYLEHFGCLGTVAASGNEVIDALRTVSFDLILMDVQMPEMDGLDTTIQIRQDARQDVRSIPIIAMTADALEGDRERCLAAGMNDYISKPVDPKQLARVLAKWLRLHR